MASFSSTLSPEGRVVIPSAIRKALALSPGDTVTFRMEGDHVGITSRAAALSQLQAMFADPASSTPPVSLSSELIDERRAEAARESSEE